MPMRSTDNPCPTLLPTSCRSCPRARPSPAPLPSAPAACLHGHKWVHQNVTRELDLHAGTGVREKGAWDGMPAKVQAVSHSARAWGHIPHASHCCNCLASGPSAPGLRWAPRASTGQSPPGAGGGRRIPRRSGTCACACMEAGAGRRSPFPSLLTFHAAVAQAGPALAPSPSCPASHPPCTTVRQARPGPQQQGSRREAHARRRAMRGPTRKGDSVGVSSRLPEEAGPPPVRFAAPVHNPSLLHAAPRCRRPILR